jgi:microcystin-dependent protein
VINYTGVIVGDTPSDLVYLRSAAPIGAVQPFAGTISEIPYGWLLCDGSVKSQNEWNDLYSVIGQNNYADAVVYDANEMVMEGNTRGLAVGDALYLTWVGGNASVIVSAVNPATRRVTLSTNAFTSVDVDTEIKVYGRSVGSTVGRSVFFLPDLRRRTVFGVSNATGLSGSGIITPAIGLGNVGGESEVTLIENNIPPHTHSLNSVVQTDSFSTSYGSSTNETGGMLGTGEVPTPVEILPPYVGMHWIIRALKGYQATILTGHNHDNFYIRYDINHTVAAGAARTLTSTDRAQFRTNAKVLRNDADDIFHGTLTVTGALNVLGVSAGTVDLVVAGGMSANYSVTDYSVTNRLFTTEAARIGLTGGNSLMITGPSTTNVRMYPALNYGITGTNRVYDQNARKSTSRNLVVDTSTGEVSCRPMFMVTGNAPPTSAAQYPEGFVWYQTSDNSDYQISSGEVGGWCYLAGGAILMRWGTVTMPAEPNSAYAVTFSSGPLFADTNYAVTATLNIDISPGGGCDQDKFAQYQNRQRNGFLLWQQGANCSNNYTGYKISWTAIGRA